jgi:very-short-patch-repair endonuclease
VSREKKGCIGSILGILGIVSKKQDHLPYKAKDTILSPAELSFFRILNGEIGNKAYVMSKVRLIDVFKIIEQRDFQSSYNRIGQKHIDFLICDSSTFTPLIGIELDDKSHESDYRKERDEFINDVFRMGGLPLVRIKARSSYNPKEIMDIIRKNMQICNKEESPEKK